MPRDIRFLKQDLTKYIQAVITNAMLKDFGERMKDIIFKRVKSGKGLASNKVSVGGNSLTRLKELSEVYVKYRKRNKPTGEFASAKRSNLTFTGELLDAIAVKIKGKSVSVEVEQKAHSKFAGGTKKLADKVSEEGRPFFGLSDTEVKILDNFVKRRIREEVRKIRI